MPLSNTLEANSNLDSCIQGVLEDLCLFPVAIGYVQFTRDSSLVKPSVSSSVYYGVHKCNQQLFQIYTTNLLLTLDYTTASNPTFKLKSENQ